VTWRIITLVDHETLGRRKEGIAHLVFSHTCARSPKREKSLTMSAVAGAPIRGMPGAETAERKWATVPLAWSLPVRNRRLTDGCLVGRDGLWTRKVSSHRAAGVSRRPGWRRANSATRTSRAIVRCWFRTTPTDRLLTEPRWMLCTDQSVVRGNFTRFSSPVPTGCGGCVSKRGQPLPLRGVG
jgi:hypothetical protein